MARCIYCRASIEQDIMGYWFNVHTSDDTPWQCPMRWDQIDQRHVPEVPHD